MEREEENKKEKGKSGAEGEEEEIWIEKGRCLSRGEEG